MYVNTFEFRYYTGESAGMKKNYSTCKLYGLRLGIGQLPEKVLVNEIMSTTFRNAI